MSMIQLEQYEQYQQGMNFQSNIRQPFLDKKPEGLPIDMIAAPKEYSPYDIEECDVTCIPLNQEEDGFETQYSIPYPKDTTEHV